MTAISSPSGQVRGQKLLPEIGSLYASPSSTYYPGGLVGHMPGSNLAVPITVGCSPDLIIVGTTNDYLVTGSTVDSNGIALDTDGITKLYVRYENGVRGYFDTGTSTHAITDSNRDRPCYAYDNNTLYLDNPGGTLPFVGIVHHVDADGSVHVYIAPQNGVGPVYTPATGGAAATYDDTVRAVATSIPAGTITNGVYTATANGAFSTAQDGVTLAVGDKFILPAGTITTLVVTAAQAGVYQVTSLGGASAKWTFQLAPSWQLGATITPETEVRVGGEGTLFKGTKWYADPASASKIVGTDDPVLYPREVTQTVTLSSSAATITNVPIKSATKSNVIASLAAVGGTTTSTIGWGIIVAPTPGGIGTATTTVNAIASGGTKNGTSDTSQLIVTIIN